MASSTNDAQKSGPQTNKNRSWSSICFCTRWLYVQLFARYPINKNCYTDDVHLSCGLRISLFLQAALSQLSRTSSLAVFCYSSPIEEAFWDLKLDAIATKNKRKQDFFYLAVDSRRWAVAKRWRERKRQRQRWSSSRISRKIWRFFVLVVYFVVGSRIESGSRLSSSSSILVHSSLSRSCIVEYQPHRSLFSWFWSIPLNQQHS